jgi:hypothetical protein
VDAVNTYTVSPLIRAKEFSMFNIGDKVEFIKYPNLKGTIRDILPAVDDLPETISVDMFIPADEPGFNYTGITENFWCGPEDLRANTGLHTDGGYAPPNGAFDLPHAIDCVRKRYGLPPAAGKA